MATQQTVVDLDIYTNTNRKSDTFGKCFARMHPKETINLRAIDNTPGCADSAYDFNVEENVVGVHIRFIPENEKFEQITSRKFMEKCVLRKAYEVTYKTVTHNSKPMKVPVYSPIVLEDGDEPTP